MIPTTSDLVTVRQSSYYTTKENISKSKNCMGAVALKLPSYPELGLVTLKLLNELLTKCGLGQYHPGQQLRMLIAGRDQARSGNRNHGWDQHIFTVLPTYHSSRIRRS